MSRFDQCDATCTTDCGHCKGTGGLDLTAAVDAVHQAECSVEGCTATSAAERAVRAALPHLRQQIRDQVARELLSVDPVEWALTGQHAGQVAANIARGQR